MQSGFRILRSSRTEVFCKKVLKKETLAQMFSCEFCEISKNTFSIEQLWWLLLYFILQNLKDNEDRLEYFFFKIMNESDFNDFDAIKDFKRFKHRRGIKSCFCFFPFLKK